MDLVRRHHPGCELLVSADYTEIVTCDWFETDYWQRQNKITGKASGRGSTVFFTEHNQEYALRHYLRGGKIAKFIKDKYFFTGFNSTRAFRELELNTYLFEKKLPMPMPVGARIIKNGLFYQADFISKKIPESETLQEYVGKNHEHADIWKDVGLTIRKFHDAGLNHADLNIRNILISNKKVYLIDFDKSRLKASDIDKANNLKRLKRSMEKELAKSGAQYARLISGYNG